MLWNILLTLQTLTVTKMKFLLTSSLFVQTFKWWEQSKWSPRISFDILDKFLLLVTPPSGRGLVIPIFFRGFFLGGGHLPQTSAFRSAKQILIVSFATQARAFILSDRNIFYTPRGRGEEQWQGLMPLGLFLFHKKCMENSKENMIFISALKGLKCLSMETGLSPHIFINKVDTNF